MCKTLMTLLILCVYFLFTPLNSLGQVESIKPITYWEQGFLAKWKTDSATIFNASNSNDSWAYYNLAYSIDGLNAIFEATGNVKYLNYNLALIDNMIHNSVPSRDIPTSQFKDGYRAWVNRSHPQLGDDGKEYPLYESYCWRYVSDLLKIMKETPSVISNSHYKSEFDQILTFTEKNIFDKWASRGEKNIYRSNVHMSSHWAAIAADLWVITNDSKYKRVFTDFSNKLHRQLVLNSKFKGVLWWNMNWNKSDQPGQDVSHGNAVVTTIIQLYKCGFGFTEDDIQKLVKLFQTKIWMPNNKYAAYIDGTGKGNGWFTDGFIKLGRFDPEVQKRLETHLVGRNIQFWGNGALNDALLKNGTSFRQDCK